MSKNVSGDTKDDDEDLPMKDITDPKETDVLCGRGGAALRHPGNQTYRRLVNLNKQLYITCLKTEKLKISRSIVAAIREQQGRFLERDAKKQTWYDIGDKKAIEKTSQALREGQPKLRQKMIDQGQIPANHGTSMEHQFGNGIYNPSMRAPSFNGSAGGSGMGSGISSAMGSGFGSGIGSGLYSSDGSQLSSIGYPQMQHPGGVSNNNTDMNPPPSRNLSNDISADVLMQRLSITSIGPPSIPSWTPSVQSVDTDGRSVRSRLRPSLQPNGSGVAADLGLGPGSAVSVMSEFSAYGGNDNTNYAVGPPAPLPNIGVGADMDGQQQFPMMSQLDNFYAIGGQSGGAMMPPPPPPAMSPMMESPSMRSGYDRRRVLKMMKNARQQSGRTSGSGSDGMPDIHMVDSNYSLMSNLSGHGSRIEGLPSFSGHTVGSRRASLMSGLSKISDHSGISVFSDLSKKLESTGISSRSIAMSEVSGFDGGFDEQDEFSFDEIGKVNS